MKTLPLSTALLIHRIGSSLLGASATITTYAIAEGNKTLALFALWAGVSGKFLADLSKSDDSWVRRKRKPKTHDTPAQNAV